MADKTLYTLDQAREILRREECLRIGQHEISQQTINTFGGTVDIRVGCSRCGSWFYEGHK